MHDFTWETTCQTCMGQFTSNNGTLSPDVIQNMIVDVNDVTTWNLAPLSPVTTIYLRNVAMTSSPFSRPAGNNGFTEYAPRHVAEQRPGQGPALRVSTEPGVTDLQPAAQHRELCGARHRRSVQSPGLARLPAPDRHADVGGSRLGLHGRPQGADDAQHQRGVQ